MNDTAALMEIRNGYKALELSQKALSERVNYLMVAVGRGDPRVCRPAHAKADFDCAGFDRWWASCGKRVPAPEEIFG